MDVPGQQLTSRDALREQAALEEIDLYGELLIAAGSSDHPLSDEEIDRALGLLAACGSR